MSNPQTSGEKLLSTVLSDFPLASQWVQMCSKHINKKSSERRFTSICLSGMAMIVAGMCFGLVVNNWALMSGALERSFAVAFCLVAATACGSGMYYWVENIFYNLSPKQQKKHLRSNKQAVRDYVAKEKAMRLVATLVPEFSTSDLKLLQSHPQFNTVFQKVFERELKKREEIQVVNNVNIRFTENHVNTQTEEIKDVFCTDFGKNAGALATKS